MCAPHSGFAAVQTEEWQNFVTLEYRLNQSYLELWVASSSWLASPGWWQPGTILPTIHKDNELDPFPIRKGTQQSHYQELKILLICHKLGEGYGIHGILEWSLIIWFWAGHLMGYVHSYVNWWQYTIKMKWDDVWKTTLKLIMDQQI